MVRRGFRAFARSWWPVWVSAVVIGAAVLLAGSRADLNTAEWLQAWGAAATIVTAIAAAHTAWLSSITARDAYAASERATEALSLALLPSAYFGSSYENGDGTVRVSLGSMDERATLDVLAIYDITGGAERLLTDGILFADGEQRAWPRTLRFIVADERRLVTDWYLDVEARADTMDLTGPARYRRAPSQSR